MNVLLIGSGGREHALAMALLASPALSSLAIAPGNAGTADFAVELDVSDNSAVTAWCKGNSIDLVVVGPEVPLVNGIADALVAAGVACCGPSQAAASLEGSKSFTRAFAERFGIPSPANRTFTDVQAALAWLDEIDFNVVVKADGLAAGKGVIIPTDRAETEQAIRSMLEDRSMGTSGQTIVLEQCMVGEELSLFGIADGSTVLTLATAQDHKRVGEGDTGPNTGGMGAFAPVPGIDSAAQTELAEMFLQPVVDGMQQMGTPYVGVIFAGIMLTEHGPRLVEYNCRFGDPEAEVILPLLMTDACELLHAAATGSLSDITINMSTETAATVVVCAEGYPASPRRGVPVPAVEVPENVTVFHAGTGVDEDGSLISTGGRVLAVTGRADSLDQALAASYEVVEQLVGDGLFARRDIGWRHAPRKVTS